MTEGWSPFRKMSQSEQRGIEMRTNSERCCVCGELLKKGERAQLGRAIKNAVAGPSGNHSLWLRHDGTQSLSPTFRHLTC